MNTEHIHEMHQHMRDLKEHWWRDHQEPDPPPTLVIGWRDHEPVLINTSAVAGLISHAHKRFPHLPLHGVQVPPDQDLTGALILWLTLSALNDGIPMPGCIDPPKGVPMERIMFNVEGWAQEVDAPGAANLQQAIEQVGVANIPQHGDMQHDFETNPASTVKETMTTYLVETGPLGTAEWQRGNSMFHKDDGGVIVWHEAYFDDSENPGHEGFDPLIDVMSHFVQREKLA